MEQCCTTYSAAAAHLIWWSDLLSVPAEIRHNGYWNRNITECHGYFQRKPKVRRKC